MQVLRGSADRVLDFRSHARAGASRRNGHLKFVYYKNLKPLELNLFNLSDVTWFDVFIKLG
ncbi:hypothetical protein BABINDRAFT_161039 [Babjeviella inositovora NRRL Y-12698]|uniref:Uncharacterized protein n=1 Tax=Babjeviella inositovora NRRL Y-12698 TaxID=984486 RepID=A0A1E3QSY9_9ASCO|nr:uncharacterized protein BABINDRAFT_161039 [Babjeviella inositovora NRRL Y-12698]ODQ80833.1 hypothetical protein BABINDRAFT_161039 [Babjeviella inositovora NRRL Y-12698]